MSGYKVEICGVNTAKLPLLTTEEKEELFKRILAGDKQAREDYIKGNLRLVLSVIQRFSGNNFDESAKYFTVIAVLPVGSRFKLQGFPGNRFHKQRIGDRCAGMGLKQFAYGRGI